MCPAYTTGGRVGLCLLLDSPPQRLLPGVCRIVHCAACSRPPARSPDAATSHLLVAKRRVLRAAGAGTAALAQRPPAGHLQELAAPAGGLLQRVAVGAVLWKGGVHTLVET